MPIAITQRGIGCSTGRVGEDPSRDAPGEMDGVVSGSVAL
jgi:hypothetical protein